MDKELLEQISYLHREKKDLTERLEELESKPLKHVKDSVQGSGTSYPFVQHHCTIEGIEYPKHGNQKRKLRKLIKSAQRNIDKKIKNLEYELEKIEDSEIRQIIRYKYEDNLSWVQVGHKMKSTGDQVRMTLKRFLENSKKK